MNKPQFKYYNHDGSETGDTSNDRKFLGIVLNDIRIIVLVMTFVGTLIGLSLSKLIFGKMNLVFGMFFTIFMFFIITTLPMEAAGSILSSKYLDVISIVLTYYLFGTQLMQKIA